MKTPLSLLPGKEKDRFVVLPPASSSTYIDVLTKDPAIQPGQVGATWYPHAPTQSDKSALSNPALTEKVVLHFHGGAYAIGDGRTDDAGFASKTFVDNTSASFVCCPQYRLSSNADGRFPAQLQDAVTSYAYLVRECGIPANKIVLSGDSAGANLALALVKYLTVCGKDAGFEERLPACAWLWSIWANPGTSVKMGEAALDSVPNKRRDYVGGGFGLWGARNLIPLPASGLDIESPWISFGGNPFRTDIPLYVSTGECEVLIRDDIQVYEEFNAIKGNRVELQVEEDCVHDVILVSLSFLTIVSFPDCWTTLLTSTGRQTHGFRERSSTLCPARGKVPAIRHEQGISVDILHISICDVNSPRYRTITSYQLGIPI